MKLARVGGYSVVIVGFKLNARERPAKVLERVLGMAPEAAKAQTRSWPFVALTDADGERAQALFEELEDAGALVELHDDAETASEGEPSPSIAAAPVTPEPSAVAPNLTVQVRNIGRAMPAPLAPPIQVAPIRVATAARAPAPARAAPVAPVAAAPPPSHAVAPETRPVSIAGAEDAAAVASVVEPPQGTSEANDLVASLVRAVAPQPVPSAAPPPCEVASSSLEPDPGGASELGGGSLDAPLRSVGDLPPIDFSQPARATWSTVLEPVAGPSLAEQAEKAPEIDFQKPLPQAIATIELTEAPSTPRPAQREIGEIDFHKPEAPETEPEPETAPTAPARAAAPATTPTARAAEPHARPRARKGADTVLELDTSAIGQRLFTARIEDAVELELDGEALANPRRRVEHKPASSEQDKVPAEPPPESKPQLFDLWLVSCPRDANAGARALHALGMPQKLAQETVYRAPVVITSGVPEVKAKRLVMVLRKAGLEVKARTSAKTDPKRSGTHERPVARPAGDKGAKSTG